MDSSKKLLNPKDARPIRKPPQKKKKMSTTKEGTDQQIGDKSAREAEKCEQPVENIKPNKNKTDIGGALNMLEHLQVSECGEYLDKHNDTHEILEDIGSLISRANIDKTLIKEKKLPTTTSTPLIPKTITVIPSTSTFLNTSNENNTCLDSAQTQNFVTKVGMDDKRFSISEFDPLHNKTPSSQFKGVSNQNILNSIVINDSSHSANKFGNESEIIHTQYNFSPLAQDEVILTNEQEHITQESVIECGQDPLPEVIGITSLASQDSDVPIIEEARPSTSKPNSSTITKFKKIFGVMSKPEPKRLQKPAINRNNSSFYGLLTWIADDHVVGMSKSWHCALTYQEIFCYADFSMKVLKESYKLNNVTSLQILPLQSRNCLYCFELGISNTEKSAMKPNSRLKVTFGCPTPAERLTWVQKIAANLTSAFPSINSSEFTRLGWCCLKVGVSGEWLSAWLLLAGRELLYYCTTDTAGNVDLRKTRYIDIQTADEESKKACPSDCETNLHLYSFANTLYLRFPHTDEIQNWNSVLNVAAHSNGLGLDEQQLTKEEIPTIVDKCINFICSYGVLSEGIYRRAGSSVLQADLLAQFRTDAWSVQLTPEMYSEHEVAGVLKRFFRDLPTPLISAECHSRLINAMAKEGVGGGFFMHKVALLFLNEISSKTTRKLFAHLNFIQKWSEVNKMSAENLAAVWAPTIMPPCVITCAQQSSWSENEVTLVRNMIVNYQEIWCPNEDEIKRDRECHRVIMRMHESARPLPQPSSAGDLRVWIIMKDTSDHFQVSLTPDKTSADVCIELSGKTNIPHHRLMLEEQICNGSMKRVVHKNEIVLDVVTRWAYWDDEDRKNNNLVIKSNRLLFDMEFTAKNLGQVSDQLRYANNSSKTFQNYFVEVNSSKLSVFANSRGSSVIEEWKISDIIWYFGHEAKRDPQCRWSITFIPKNKNRRSKEHPFFGSTIAGGVQESRLRWATALTFAHHDAVLTLPKEFLLYDH